MLLANVWTLIPPPLASFLLLAQEAEPEKGYNIVWAIVFLCIILGLMLTLRATKREPIKDKPLDV